MPHNWPPGGNNALDTILYIPISKKNWARIFKLQMLIIIKQCYYINVF